MSPSFGSNETGVPIDEHGVTLTEDRLDDTALLRDWESSRGRHAQPDRDVDQPIEPLAPAAVAVDAVEHPAGSAVAEVADDWDEPEDFRFIVRPYTWTQGRTRPVQDLAVETLVSTSDAGRDVITTHTAEHSAIAGLCADARSVAEVAALLALPLGVARVLLADMIDTGLVHVHRNPTEVGSPPGLSLMERVLGGLHQL
ncbi:MAG: DUF742 domain-containing protein [Pseudonocardiaceae bacterium]